MRRRGNENGSIVLGCACVMRWHKHKHYDRFGERDPSGDGVMVVSECADAHKETMLAKQKELGIAP